MMRTIMIFPHFQQKDLNNIQNVRHQYDPLADLVMPHITLVFPFEDERTNEEIGQMLSQELQKFKPFSLQLQGISKRSDSFGNYLFLNVIKGDSEITKLHTELDQVLGKQSKLKQVYTPHLTIGNLNSVAAMNQGYDKVKMSGLAEITFETFVTKISVEMIGPHEESIIVCEASLE